MATRVKVNANTKIFTDATEKSCIFGPDAPSFEGVYDVMEEASNGRMQIAVSTAATLPLGTVDSPKGVLLISDQDLDLVFNGGAEILTLRKVTTTGYARLLFEGDFSSLSITNPSLTAVATILFAVWGDPTP